MKKLPILCVCALLVSVLMACSFEPAKDLSGFLEGRVLCGDSIDATDVLMPDEMSFFVARSDVLSLRLFQNESGFLYETRVILRKADKKGEPLKLTKQDADAFLHEAASTLCAFMDLSRLQAEETLGAFQLDENSIFVQQGELTQQAGHYHLLYLSTPLESVLCVRHLWLTAVASTLKPESRPLFDDTTVTRKETVPHR